MLHQGGGGPRRQDPPPHREGTPPSEGQGGKGRQDASPRSPFLFLSSFNYMLYIDSCALIKDERKKCFHIPRLLVLYKVTRVTKIFQEYLPRTLLCNNYIIF